MRLSGWEQHMNGGVTLTRGGALADSTAKGQGLCYTALPLEEAQLSILILLLNRNLNY